MKVENVQVKSIYSRWNRILENRELEIESRVKAFSILRVIEALVEIYENSETLDDEELDDLFIKWSKDFRPLLPEDRIKLKEKLKQRLKR